MIFNHLSLIYLLGNKIMELLKCSAFYLVNKKMPFQEELYIHKKDLESKYRHV